MTSTSDDGGNDAPLATSQFDWERDVYRKRKQINRYPFDAVVAFVARHTPRDVEPSSVGILEVGCGTANNLWFAAREGFRVAGIDISPTAISHARHRFVQEGLKGDLLVGAFTDLPFRDGYFDMVIDRGAITCAAPSDQTRSIGEVKRVLKEGGMFFFNPFSKRHSGFSKPLDDEEEKTPAVQARILPGVGRICFYDRSNVGDVLTPGWKLVSVQHVEIGAESPQGVHAEWRVIAQKTSGDPALFPS